MQLTLNEIQAESLRILMAVHTFCVANNISYSLTGGTLIGAMRHKGFIPWDDDIDILMRRSDFKRFCSSFKMEGYELKQPGDKGFYLKFARVLDTNRTIVKNHKMPFTDVATGLWIDIFPIDTVPEDENEFKQLALFCNEFKRHTWNYRRLLYKKKTFMRDISFNTIKSLFDNFKKVLRYNLKYRSLKPLYKQISDEANMLSSLSSIHSDYCGGLCFAFRDYFTRYKKSWFDEYILTPFENVELYVIKDYDKFLTAQYGDYMQIPPKDKQITHTNYTVHWR